MTPERLTALLLPWLGRGAAYAGLASGVRGLVLDGRLAAGARVPSERALAATSGLSRTTVSAAYDVLRSQGYLTSARGAGSRVSLPATAPQRPDGPPSGWPAEDPEVVVDLTVAALPAPPQLVEAVERAVRALPRELAGPGLHPLGLAALREGVAVHLTGRGLATTADQVLVTGGALAGWDLLLRTLTRPGDRVLVEQPTYPGVLDAVTAQQRRPVALPVSAHGWEAGPPAAGRAALVHVTPDGQNPTGLVATTEQRAALVGSLASAPGAPTVAVDESFADLVLDGPVPARTATLDPRVVTLGSLNKLVWPGLRTGWLRADTTLVARLARARGGVDLASPVLEQLIALAVLEVVDDVLAERKAALRRARHALLAALRHHLPAWRCTPPRGGMVLWVELPAAGSTLLAAHALDLGVRLTPGPRFTLDGTADRWVRLPLTVAPERADAVVALLAAAWSRVEARAPARRAPAGWTA